MTFKDKIAFNFYRWLYLQTNEIVRIAYEKYWTILRTYEPLNKKAPVPLKSASKTLVHQLKPYWAEVTKIEEAYWAKMNKLEAKMNKELGMKDLEIFHVDGTAVGVGNTKRTMKLIHAEELLK